MTCESFEVRPGALPSLRRVKRDERDEGHGGVRVQHARATTGFLQIREGWGVKE